MKLTNILNFNFTVQQKVSILQNWEQLTLFFTGVLVIVFTITDPELKWTKLINSNYNKRKIVTFSSKP